MSNGTSSLPKTCGANQQESLGDGTTTFRTTPITPNVGSGVIIKISATGGSPGTVGALKANGDYWSWGYGYFGAVGSGLSTDTLSPILVQTGVVDLPLPYQSSPRYNHYSQMFILKSDGLYTTGNNDHGYLGIGTAGGGTTQQYTFIRVLLPQNNQVKLMGMYSLNR